MSALSDDRIAVPIQVPALLAFVAGAVDACTFLALFGLFVAQVTGSFVIVGTEIVNHDPTSLIRILAIPVFFVAGAATVFLVGINRHGPRGALAWALAIETALLAAFAATGLAAAPFPGPNAPGALLASMLGLVAMGVQSAIVRLALRGVASTNVMTTNTTQIAIDVAEWLAASLRHRRAPHDAAMRQSRDAAGARVAALGPIIAAFLAGTLAGAMGFAWLGFGSLLLPIGIVAGLFAWAWRRRDGRG